MEERNKPQRKEVPNGAHRNTEGVDWLALFRSEGDGSEKPREIYKLWISLNPFRFKDDFQPKN
jgi:hypothetical protein